MGDDALRDHEGSRASSLAAAAGVAEAHELLFGLCHEIGNLVTAVQFEADLLGETESPRGLAASAVRIEDLCSQVGGLLSQVRPLLADSSPLSLQVDPEAIVTAAKSEDGGSIGDGKIFVTELAECVRIRTGERGQEAI